MALVMVADSIVQVSPHRETVVSCKIRGRNTKTGNVWMTCRKYRLCAYVGYFVTILAFS